MKENVPTNLPAHQSFREGLLAVEIKAMRNEFRYLRLFPIIAGFSLMISAISVFLVGVVYLRGPRVVVKTAEGEVVPAWQVADEKEREHFILIFLNRLIETDPRTIHAKLYEAFNMMDDGLAKSMAARMKQGVSANQMERLEVVTILEPQKIESVPFESGYLLRLSGIKRTRSREIKDNTERVESVQYLIRLRNVPREMKNYWLGLEVISFEENVLVKS